MTIEEVVCDDLLEITVTDLRPVAWVGRSGLASRMRLSTRQRAQRYGASLLALTLLALNLLPGGRAYLPDAFIVTPASAEGAASPRLPALIGGRPSLWSRAERRPGEDSPPVRRHNMTFR